MKMFANNISDTHAINEEGASCTRDKARHRSQTLSLLLMALLIIGVIVGLGMMHRRLSEVENNQFRLLQDCKTDMTRENAGNENRAQDRIRRSAPVPTRNVLTIEDVQAEIKRTLNSGVLSQFCKPQQKLCVPSSPCPKGRRGPKGRTGKIGPQGIIGPPGRHGKQGPHGPMGMKGDDGDPGPQGMPGVPGESIAVPEIFVSPESMTVSENQDASYMCSAQGNPRPTVEWSKNGSRISNDRINITSRGELKVLRSQYNDSGDYTCQAENILGKAEATIHLNVEFPPKFTKKPVSVISIDEGKTGTLICEASGNPPPVLRWTKPFMVLPAGRSEVRGSRLSFWDFEPTDSGLYACEATNKLGSIQTLVTVNFIKKKFIKVELESGGYDDKVRAMSIKVDGVELSPRVRGHSIVALNNKGKLHSRATFDTYGDSEASNKMGSYINSIPEGSIVLIVTQDSAEHYYNATALKSVGAQDPLDEGYRGSWYLVGYKGRRQPWMQQGSKPRYKGPISTTVFIPLP